MDVDMIRDYADVYAYVDGGRYHDGRCPRCDLPVYPSNLDHRTMILSCGQCGLRVQLVDAR